MKRELSALAHRSEEEKGTTNDCHSCESLVMGDGRLVNSKEVPGANGETDKDRTKNQPDIGDLVGEEGLVAGLHVLEVLPVEADQEVGGETDSLPADDHLDEVGGADQDQHRTCKERESGEEPGHPAVALHVAHGIDEHDQPNQAH